MSEELIIQHCSPTLAGMKTGSMFCCSYTSEESLRFDIRHMNKRLSSKGLRFIPLRTKDGRALIYVYRPSSLKRDLSDERAAGLLRSLGYPLHSPSGCVSCLKSRIAEKTCFPHEVGMFLGYPPEDVIGFIENKASGHKFSGFWKVYGDTRKAKKTFARYKKCTGVYNAHSAQGTPIERLTVAG